MLFPESARTIYDVNPLAEVICQFRFPTILRIREGRVSEFQDIIRNDYPVYTEHEPTIEMVPQLPKELATIIGHINFPMPLGLSTRRFATKDSKRFISLRDEHLSLAETEYKRWESFRDEIVKAENALRKVYQPSFYSRVGLRYRNIISRRRLGLENVSWKDLLKPHITAELADDQVSDSIARIETRVAIKIPEVPVGQIILIHGLTKPQKSDDECYLIDADFSVETKEGVDEPFRILDRFHLLAGQLFNWAIKPRLHEAMGPRSV